jgi:hypothetical protein
MMANAKAQNTINLGNHIIIAGLLIQLIFFGFFIIISIVFHHRMLASPTEASTVVNVPWSRYMMIMYAVNALIMIHSVYRVIEYVQGAQGVLQEHKAYLFILIPR